MEHNLLTSSLDSILQSKTSESTDILEMFDNGLQFFSRAEWKTCHEIVQSMKKNRLDVFLALPSYAQDKLLCQRLKNMMQSPLAEIVCIESACVDIIDFMKIILQNTTQGQYFLQKTTDIATAFSGFLIHAFEQKHKLIFLMMNADEYSLAMVNHIYALKYMIYEKYPHKKYQTLCRFVWMGHETIYHHLKHIHQNHKNTSPVMIHPTLLTPKDIGYFVHLYQQELVAQYDTDAQNLTMQDYQVIAQAVAGSFVRLRMILPLQLVPTDSQDKKIAFYHQIASETLPDEQKAHFLHDSQLYAEVITPIVSHHHSYWKKLLMAVMLCGVLAIIYYFFKT